VSEATLKALGEAIRKRAAQAPGISITIGAEHDDPTLEALAMAEGGLALVSHGRISEGFARLDAALAAITAGEVASRAANPTIPAPKALSERPLLIVSKDALGVTRRSLANRKR